MAELRWNPLLRDWTMVASHRQNRPDMPKDWCPFCTGSGRVPENYEVYKYDNDFPALSQAPEAPAEAGSEFYLTRPAYGKCEVILYSPNHHGSLGELSVGHIQKLVDLWVERFTELSKDENIKYIYIFENRGKEVGVTMPHPHGQIYGYSFIPLKVKTEIDSAFSYYEEHGECLFCKMNKEEISFNDRVIIENDDFLCYLPFFTDYPFGVFITSKRHLTNMADFSDDEKMNFAKILKDITATFDALFDKEFPYMMAIHQSPVNSEELCGIENYFHFHVEFYPPLRSEGRIKYNASSETGAWANCNPRSVEDTALELRAAYKKYKKQDVR